MYEKIMFFINDEFCLLTILITSLIFVFSDIFESIFEEGVIAKLLKAICIGIMFFSIMGSLYVMIFPLKTKIDDITKIALYSDSANNYIIAEVKEDILHKYGDLDGSLKMVTKYTNYKIICRLNNKNLNSEQCWNLVKTMSREKLISIATKELN